MVICSARADNLITFNVYNNNVIDDIFALRMSSRHLLFLHKQCAILLFFNLVYAPFSCRPNSTEEGRSISQRGLRFILPPCRYERRACIPATAAAPRVPFFDDGCSLDLMSSSWCRPRARVSM